MLRIIKKPANHAIFKLHQWLEQLVCAVWCEADVTPCEQKLPFDFKVVYEKYDWIKQSINDIYDLCKNLSAFEKKQIKDAFIANNKIEALCNGTETPFYLDTLPDIVKNNMKPFFIKLYEDGLEVAKIPGDKLKYYQEIQKLNDFAYCPCCGYMAFEGANSKDREDYDHFLPKAHYPFASVNFDNLVPLCTKCNQKNKKDKDPLQSKTKSKRKTFYPFRSHSIDIQIETHLSNSFMDIVTDILITNTETDIQAKDLNISLKSTHEQEAVDTWNDLFNIQDRYFERVKFCAFPMLRKLKRKQGRNKIHDTIQAMIEERTHDYFLDENFLKIAYLKSLLKEDW